MKNKPIKPYATSTDLRAAFASGTVKKRIIICGRPAIPKTRPRDSEIIESGSAAIFSGPRICLPLWWLATALSIMCSMLKPKC
ncbi:hypothetical protein D3C72_2241630 [compost metagenome]